MSACPKIINFGAQIPPKINEKMILEKNIKKTTNKSIWDDYGLKKVPKGSPNETPRQGYSISF